MATVCEPVIEHFAPPGFALGRTAALAVIDRIEDPSIDPIRTLLPCTLHPGASVAPVHAVPAPDFPPPG